MHFLDIVMMRKYTIILLLSLLSLPFTLRAHRLSLPNIEQLSSGKVLYVMQDREGFLWYATDGGGICRDDGRQVDVFRSDAEHPDLLGSNTVVCLAECGNRIIIGTTHGANVLDKSDYSISSLTAVDDKRVDDIIVTANGHWWLTANKKVYEYSPDGKLLRALDAGDKYIFRLHENPQGQLLCTQWEGGTLRLDGGRFVQVDTEWPDSIDFSRVTTDNQGRLLVADGFGGCYAVSADKQECWFDGIMLTKEFADSVRLARQLSARPTAMAVSRNGELWFSTGKDIRCKRQGGEEIIISDTRDVSAMVFAPDGSLWLATIFGHLYRYVDGEIKIDEYGSNEYGDGVTAMSVDSAGRISLLSDRYIRIYDPVRKTMRQQSRETDGTYMIELRETVSGCRWSQPLRDNISGRLPVWIWWVLTILLLALSALAYYALMLRRQRRRFMRQIKNEDRQTEITAQRGNAEQQPVHTQENEWVQRAIAQIEAHMNDEGYTVEQLSNDMCMSRMTFYRKIQSATGHTPTEFMRTIRLRRAAELLREGSMNVTEISYATGFSSVSYFSRCFRAMYGVPPTRFCDGTSVET